MKAALRIPCALVSAGRRRGHNPARAPRATERKPAPQSDKTKRELRPLGLNRLNDIAVISEKSMTERFGAEGKRAEN